MGDEIRQAGRGPVAINSKLGWLLSGPLHSADCDNITSTNMIISYMDNCAVPTKDDELVCSLKGFWEMFHLLKFQWAHSLITQSSLVTATRLVCPGRKDH